MDLAQISLYVPLSQILTPVLVIASVGIAYKAFRTARIAIQENVWINKRNKRADAIFHCNTRYDTLYALRVTEIPSKPQEAQPSAIRSYYARYWGLKSDEFDYWLAELVDIETFCNWTFLMQKAFRTNSVVGTDGAAISFEQGWNSIGKDDHDVTNEWFYQFTCAIAEIGIFAREKKCTNEHIHQEIISVIRILIEASKKYRENLQRDMSIDQYIESREEHRELELGMRDRGSKLFDLYP